MADAKLSVNGMTCQMCVKHVKKAIEGFSSAADVNVDLDSKEAKFTFDSSVDSVESIIEAINKAGYEASAK